MNRTGITLVICTVMVMLAAFVVGGADGREKDEKQSGKSLKGEITDGPYYFEYESAIDGEQVVYKIRNKSPSTVTAISWKSQDEVLIETRLPQGKKEPQDDDWITVTKTGGEAPRVSDSTITYGEKNEKKKVKAYVVSRKEIEPKKEERDEEAPAQRLERQVTGIKGSPANQKGTPIHLNVSVASSAEVRTAEYRLNYEWRAMEKGPVFVLVVRSIDVRRVNKEGPPPIFWESALSSGMVRQRVRQQEIDSTVLEHVDSKNIRLAKDLLVVGSGGERIMATTAPAYVPAAEPDSVRLLQGNDSLHQIVKNPNNVENKDELKAKPGDIIQIVWEGPVDSEAIPPGRAKVEGVAVVAGSVVWLKRKPGVCATFFADDEGKCKLTVDVNTGKNTIKSIECSVTVKE